MSENTVEDEFEIALAYAYKAAFGKEASQDWLRALAMRFGVHGSVATLDQAGDAIGVTRERVRQVAKRVEPFLKRASVSNLREVAEVLAARSPVPEPIGRRLARTGLTRPTMSGAGFLNILKLLGTSAVELVGTDLVQVDDWLVNESEVPVMKSMSMAKKHTSAYGLTTVEEIRQALATPAYPLDSSDIRRILRAEPSVKWAGDWLWVERENDGLHANRLINTARSILSVNSPQTIASIHEGARRMWKFRGLDILPPTEAMRIFFEQSPYFTVDKDTVESVTPLKYRDLLGEVTATMIDVLKSSPFQVMDRQSLTEACDDAGIAPGTYGIWTTYAEWMERFAPNVWGLRGSNPNPAAVETIRLAAKARSKAEPRRKAWAWSTDGSAVQTLDVTTSILASGVLSFDQGIHGLLAGSPLDVFESGEKIATVKLGAEHGFSWGWHQVFNFVGAKQGDVLQVRVNVGARTATVECGGQDLWD
ncbi:hypothetical protein [Homoserinimonas sp. A520]